MRTYNTENIPLAEAVRIGDNLIARAVSEESGLSWRFYKAGEQQSEPEERFHLYSGNSGVVLFLINLYMVSGEQRFLTAAQQGLNHLDSKIEVIAAGDLAFLTGKYSYAYLLKRFYEVTGDLLYLNRAVAFIVADFPDEKVLSQRPKEFLNGVAGILLVVAQVYQRSRDERLEAIIVMIVDILIRSARIGHAGIYWDRSAHYIHPLCGFSHGASGIAFVLIEVSRWFKVPSLFWLAQEAFRYEDSYLKDRSTKWPDLRRGVFSDADKSNFRDAYDSGSLAFFVEESEMNAWCHGAPGIALARAAACNYSSFPCYSQSVRIIAEQVHASIVQACSTDAPVSFSLCHGAGGNAESIILSAVLHGETPLFFQQLAFCALSQHKKRGYYPSGASNLLPGDPSLFLGDAGVGYFYLRLARPLLVPSILAPSIEKVDEVRTLPGLSLSTVELKKQVLRRHFPLTFDKLCPADERILTEKLCTEGADDDLLRVWYRFICLMRVEGRPLERVFQLEKNKLDHSNSVLSDSLLVHRQHRVAEDVLRLLETFRERADEVELVFNKDILLCHYSGRGEDANASDNENDSFFMLRLNAAFHSEDVPLNHLTYHLFKFFVTPIKVGEAIRRCAIEYEVSMGEPFERLKPLLLSQVTESIKAGLLIDPAKHPIAAVASLTLYSDFIVKEPLIL